MMNSNRCLGELWQKTLFGPIDDLLARPKKEIREQMIALGFALVSERSPSELEKVQLAACSRLIEYLHTGSLIVDDIQDSSEVRRGARTLHLKYGLATALNAGNWLYFYAFEYIKNLEIDGHLKSQLMNSAHETMLKAHYGQALDVGVSVDQLLNSDIVEVCKASLELKSGALMSLAFKLGALVAKASPERLKAIEEFGLRFGVVLQMFDDLGNLRADRPTPKHLEDLAHRRPSFAWWYLADKEPQLLFQLRFAASGLPNTELLEQFLASSKFKDRARDYAWNYFEQSFNDLQTQLGDVQNFTKTLAQVRAAGERIANAY